MKIECTVPVNSCGDEGSVTINISKQIWMAYALPLMFEHGWDADSTISRAEVFWKYIEKQQ